MGLNRAKIAFCLNAKIKKILERLFDKKSLKNIKQLIL